MYITKFHNPFIYTIKDDQRCKMFIQQTLTDTENIDLLQKYKN